MEKVVVANEAREFRIWFDVVQTLVLFVMNYYLQTAHKDDFRT